MFLFKTATRAYTIWDDMPSKRKKYFLNVITRDKHPFCHTPKPGSLCGNPKLKTSYMKIYWIVRNLEKGSGMGRETFSFLLCPK